VGIHGDAFAGVDEQILQCCRGIVFAADSLFRTALPTIRLLALIAKHVLDFTFVGIDFNKREYTVSNHASKRLKSLRCIFFSSRAKPEVSGFRDWRVRLDSGAGVPESAEQPRNFSMSLGFYSVCMEVSDMLKKSVAALFGLVFAIALITPPKANAEVVVGVGVGVRPGYGYVVAGPRPQIYVATAPYVAYAPGYVYPPVVYPGRVVVGVGYARPYGCRYGWHHGYGWRR
jgi:hypothetical protein